MPIFSPNVIQEAKKKSKNNNKKQLVLAIIKTDKSKEQMMAELKKIDDGNGGTKWGDPGYMKNDVFNALISCILGVPSGFTAAGITAGLLGVPVGLLGLYLTGVIFHLRATKYDKFHLLEHYESKMKGKKKILEKAAKDPKIHPDAKKKIEERIKEADKCIKACDKERRKLLPKEVQDKASEFDDLDDFDFDFDDDWDNWDDIDLEEAASYNGHLNPVFLINVYNHHLVGKAIRAYTGDKYTHSLLSLSSSLDEMYTFSGSDEFKPDLDIGRNHFGGITIETYDGYMRNAPNTDCMISCLFLKDKEFRNLKVVLDNYMNHYKTSRYDLTNLVNIALNKPVAGDQYAMVCSQFVAAALKLCGVDLVDEPINLVTPGKLSRVTNPKVYLLYEGKLKLYDSKKIDRKIKKLLNSTAEPIVEAVIQEDYRRQFDAEFDGQGNLIIAKKDKLDIDTEYKQSKQLYPIYKKANNIEAMKFEATKLWYMNTLMERKIAKTRTQAAKEKQYELRSKVLNEFALYIRYIESKDSSYNFAKEYRNSPFCSAQIKLNQTTLKYITNAINLALKVL